MSERKDSKRSGGSQGTTAKQQSSLPRIGSKRRSLRRSRSSDAEREGRRAERRRDREEGRERGRSEERRGERGQRSTQAPEEFREETECMVCFCPYDNVFKAPKVLACGHTFCLECLARINVSSPELKFVSCPVCRGLTNLPHGRDLPHLENNKDVFKKMPPEMQRPLSVRFKRSEGKLVLKKAPTKAPGGSTKSSLILPGFKKKEQAGQQVQGGDPQLGTVELGIAPTTTIDVGRPPSRVRGRLRQIVRSNQCYYVVVAAIIIVTVALMLVGILTFVVLPGFGTSYIGTSQGSETTLKPAEGHKP
ncbi:RING finger protein 225-like [Scleropages formosus]|nr:RING finger protein 225-like [Scleropages formosus]